MENDLTSYDDSVVSYVNGIEFEVSKSAANYSDEYLTQGFISNLFSSIENCKSTLYGLKKTINQFDEDNKNVPSPLSIIPEVDEPLKIMVEYTKKNK